MANTYYDSHLTAEEIESALEAIDGVIEPANNGKVLAIENGKIVPKSATEYVDLNLQAKTVTPSASQQVVAPDSSYNGLSTVTVNGDADLVAGNIKKDVEIFGVTGSYEGGSPALQSKTVTPGASQQTVQPDSGYDGLSSVVVNGDSDLVAGNIKKDIEIFGVTGSYEGGTPKLYVNYVQILNYNIANGLICTLSGREYRKYNNEMCICAYVYRDSHWTCPILVGKTQESVLFTVEGNVHSAAYQLTYNDETWYFTDGDYAMPGDYNSTGGFAQKLNNITSFSSSDSQRVAAFALLDYFFQNAKMLVSANGNYPIPSGYDGFGPLHASISPLLQSKTVTQNGLVLPDTGYDGLSQVNVNVSSSQSDFQLLRYIRSNGTQAIDLLRSVSAGEAITVDFYWPETNAYRWMLGCAVNSSQYIGWQFRSGSEYAYHNGTLTITALTSTFKSVRYTFTVNQSSANNLCVFGIRLLNDTPSRFGNGDMYGLQVGNDIYVPCKQISTGICGLYDIANVQFLTDVMSGDPFVAGPVLGYI